MSRKISLPAAIVLILLAALLSFQITYVSMLTKYQSEVQSLAASQSAYDKLNYVDALYRAHYVGDIDEEQLSDYR